MPHIQGLSRTEVWQFPPRLDDFISTENPVRLLDVFVEQLNLEVMGFSRVQAALEGQPSYQPGELLKLYLYGYLNRIRKASMSRGRKSAQCGSDVVAQVPQARPQTHR